jgi:hypothetical protein
MGSWCWSSSRRVNPTLATANLLWIDAAPGFTNLPEHVPVLGEQPVFEDSWYSIELFAYHFVPERNETLRFRLEEDAYFNTDTQSWRFVYGRQEEFYLISSNTICGGQNATMTVQDNKEHFQLT